MATYGEATYGTGSYGGTVLLAKYGIQPTVSDIVVDIFASDIRLHKMQTGDISAPRAAVVNSGQTEAEIV